MDFVSVSPTRKDSVNIDAKQKNFVRWKIVLAAQLIDIFVIIAVSLSVYPVSGGSLDTMPLRYIYCSVAAAVICHFSFAQGHAYDIDILLDETRGIRVIFMRWSILFLGSAAFAALTRQPDIYSRLWFSCDYVMAFCALAAERSLIALIIRRAIRQGFVARSVVLVGNNALSERLITRLEKKRSGIRIVGIFDDKTTDEVINLYGPPLLGTVDDLLIFSASKPIDLVVITLPLSEVDELNHVIRRLRRQPLNIRVLPGQIGLDRTSSMKLSRTDLPGVQLMTVADRPISELALLVKGGMDRLFAFFSLMLLSPIFLIISVGIACSSPGPVMFRQTRIGFKGKPFQIYKFRTMHHEITGSYTPTRRNDSRIFPFGAILRKTSLDELPQLINVINGDMSLVGPRPHMVGQKVNGQFFDDAVAEYAARHRVKPGITGWAQVNGWRGPTDTVEQVERRVEHDIYYIENWSILFDLMILTKTVFVGLFGDNVF